MALINEGELQGNIQQILALLKKSKACDQIATALWSTSSVVGPVFVTINKCGSVTVYTQPGGAVLAPAAYGTLTP